MKTRKRVKVKKGIKKGQKGIKMSYRQLRAVMDSDTLALLYFIVILLIMVNGSRAAAPKGTMSGGWRPEAGGQRPEAGSWRPEAEGQRLEARSGGWRPEAGGQRLEARGWRPDMEAGGQRLEARGRRPEA